MTAKRFLEEIGAVVRHDDEIAVQSIGQARRAGIDRRRLLRAETVGRRADGVHHLIVIAVKIAFELEDLRFAGERTRQPQAVHGRFSARSGETDALATGNHFTQKPGQLGVQFVLVRAGRAAS